MDRRPLGRTDLLVSPVGFGAFKIGRNQGIKYPSGYQLPNDDDVERLLNGVLDLGINLIDTAPAYGLSEERIGRVLEGRRDEFILSTKVGERFVEGHSHFDFTADGVRTSIDASLRALRTEQLDLVYVHSDGDDLSVIESTDVLPTLLTLRDQGVIRWLGFSGKTTDGARRALDLVDVLMVPFNLEDRTHADVIQEAAEHGVGVVVKKGLASGRLAPADALRFVLGQAGIASVVIGSLSLDHLADAIRLAETTPSSTGTS